MAENEQMMEQNQEILEQNEKMNIENAEIKVENEEILEQNEKLNLEENNKEVEHQKGEIAAQNKEINLQNEEIDIQNQEIAEQNQEIKEEFIKEIKKEISDEVKEEKEKPQENLLIIEVEKPKIPEKQNNAEMKKSIREKAIEEAKIKKMSQHKAGIRAPKYEYVHTHYEHLCPECQRRKQMTTQNASSQQQYMEYPYNQNEAEDMYQYQYEEQPQYTQEGQYQGENNIKNKEKNNIRNKNKKNLYMMINISINISKRIMLMNYLNIKLEHINHVFILWKKELNYSKQ